MITLCMNWKLMNMWRHCIYYNNHHPCIRERINEQPLGPALITDCATRTSRDPVVDTIVKFLWDSIQQIWPILP